MKYISLIIIIYLFTSCHSSSKKEIFCIKDVSYDSREMTLTPALIKIIIKDHNGIISKGIKANLVKDVIFYSIEKQDRFYFKKGDYYEEKDGDITIGVSTNFFDTEKDNKRTAEQIEDFLIQKGIGLVIGTDTIKAQECN